MRFAILCLFPPLAAAQTWSLQTSGVTASLRGVAAVSRTVAWASGTGGTWLRTEDGGATWTSGKVPGAETLDFRDLHAVDARTAFLMSIGSGPQSRIYKTADAGLHWQLLFTNPDAQGFFDAIAFWDPNHGIVVGDPPGGGTDGGTDGSMGGRMAVFTTEDGGAHWTRRQPPPALPGEGAFAASGTCLIARSPAETWFATGGKGAARVFHSTDGGRSWSVAPTPIRNDSASAGIFSLDFSDALHGIAVGGDYSKPEASDHNIAVTSDGGRSWSQPSGTPPAGFRSAVLYLPDARLWIATGTSGSDVSSDNGRTWRTFDHGAFNALAFASQDAGWAVGPKGRIAAIHWLAQ
jgi:photosystem II stability/assembly factor-like uncharacterized protein